MISITHPMCLADHVTPDRICLNRKVFNIYVDKTQLDLLNKPIAPFTFISYLSYIRDYGDKIKYKHFGIVFHLMYYKDNKTGYEFPVWVQRKVDESTPALNVMDKNNGEEILNDLFFRSGYSIMYNTPIYGILNYNYDCVYISYRSNLYNALCDITL